jgi:hypothetical protein
MPQLIRYISDILREAGRDMYLVHFGKPLLDRRTDTAAAEQHRAWFREQRLRTEPAAPDGWVGGNFGILAVHFTGADDLRIAAYSARFETAEGKSLSPDNYQMYLYRYVPSRRVGGRRT